MLSPTWATWSKRETLHMAKYPGNVTYISHFIGTAKETNLLLCHKTVVLYNSCQSSTHFQCCKYPWGSNSSKCLTRNNKKKCSSEERVQGKQRSQHFHHVWWTAKGQNQSTISSRKSHCYSRNRKHVPCFYRVLEIRVEVLENEKCCFAKFKILWRGFKAKIKRFYIFYYPTFKFLAIYYYKLFVMES